MMVLLSKREYDDLVKKATAADLLAEEKFEAMKSDFKDHLQKAISSSDLRYGMTVQSLADKVREILTHY